MREAAIGAAIVAGVIQVPYRKSKVPFSALALRFVMNHMVFFIVLFGVGILIGFLLAEIGQGHIHQH